MNKEKLLTSVLQSCNEEYDELCSDWKFLDSKTQSNLATCAVLMAGAFVFVRVINDQLIQFERIGILIACFFLSASMALSVWALLVRTTRSGPRGTALAHLVNDLDAVPILDEEHLVRWLGDQIKMFEKASLDVSRTNKSKAKILLAGQICLLISMVLLCVAVFAGVFLGKSGS